MSQIGWGKPNIYVRDLDEENSKFNQVPTR